MADSKITQLNENTSPALTDLFVIVDDPSGSPVTQKVTLANIQTFLSQLSSSSYLYFGSPTTNGSWRIGVSGGNLVFQKRETGSWVTKGGVA